jgi:hypothetical protein
MLAFKLKIMRIRQGTIFKNIFCGIAVAYVARPKTTKYSLFVVFLTVILISLYLGTKSDEDTSSNFTCIIIFLGL